MAAQRRKVLGSHAAISGGQRADRYKPLVAVAIPRSVSSILRSDLDRGCHGFFAVFLRLQAEVVRNSEIDVERLPPKVLGSLESCFFVGVGDERSFRQDRRHFGVPENAKRCGLGTEVPQAVYLEEAVVDLVSQVVALAAPSSIRVDLCSVNPFVRAAVMMDGYETVSSP